MTKRIIVGVCGGIAAYKTAMFVSRLVQRGFDVSVVMTKSSKEFVGPSTFAALCSRQPIFDVFDSRFPRGAHIELAESSDLLVIAPATARIMASCAHAMADDLLATLYLHFEGPVLMAPAMSTPMWEKSAVQRNREQLIDDGVLMVGPEAGWLSCRRTGIGRMAEPEQILQVIDEILKS